MSTEANILIVDDEMGIREGCKRALSEEGYAADAAEDGQTGLQKVKEKNYDLILVDLMMPGIGGMELIKKIHHWDPEIIMIVITGNATIETAVEATKLGAYDYLPKPFSPEALTAVVKRGLEKRILRLEAKKLHAERTQRLLELVNERSRLRTIIGCMADGVLVANLEGRLVLWNASSVKMLKSKGFDIAGEPLEYYISNEPLIAAIKEVLISEDKDFSMVSHEIPAQDEKVILMANIAPVRDEDGKILGAVTVLRDITALKEINKIKYLTRLLDLGTLYPAFIVGDNVIRAVPVIHLRLECLYLLLRNDGPAESPDELFTLTTEHATADDLDPTDFTIHYTGLKSYPSLQGVGQ